MGRGVIRYEKTSPHFPPVKAHGHALVLFFSNFQSNKKIRVLESDEEEEAIRFSFKSVLFHFNIFSTSPFSIDSEEEQEEEGTDSEGKQET